MDHNRCHLVGRLTKDPEYIPAGRRGEEHCTFTLAVNRVVPNETGPKADYVPCSLWGENARAFVENRAKGDEVGVIGRMRTNFVQQPDGTHRLFFEIRVEEIHLGRRALKNLQPRPQETPTTRAIGQLTREFGDNG